MSDLYIKAVAPSVSRSTATLMKTGQTTSYRTGDDGDLEAGRATSFLVLAENNPFGNTNRFTDTLGGSTYTNNIVIDWSTYNGVNVLGWDRRTNGGNSNTDKTWNNAIDEASLHSIGGFTSGWRLPNVIEIVSLANFETPSLNYAPFNIGGNTWWVSSTLKISTTFAYYLGGNDCQIRYTTKTSSAGYRWLAVRTFTVTGTILS